ncbi:MAG: His-Xaa-Ser system radical SAM maturase HxsB [Nitrospirota bacterium]
MKNKTINPYIILPFHFMRFKKDHVLIVNLVGEYFYLSADDFAKMVDYSLNPKSDLYFNLKAKHFIAETLSDPAIELLTIKYRTKKGFLSDFTSLHMFVITLRCNHKCTYCHASSKDTDKKVFDMSMETAKKAVDITLMSPSKSIKIEFQGGEPLLNFETIQYIIEYAKSQAALKRQKIEFVVCTNLTLVTDEMLKYFADNNILLSISLDGPEHVHNYNRHYRDGSGSHEDVLRYLDKARKYIKPENISALMTTTKHSLNFSSEIVDEYIRNGFRSIFIRTLNPFGYALPKMDEIGYSASEFIDFYKRILDYIIKINQKGIYIEESFTSLLLTRILTPFSTGFVDLQFPAGISISGVIYDYNGNVYSSDEARMLAQMGDSKFCIGNLHTNTYKELFYNNTLQKIIKSTCAESLPGCSDCAFQMYCGVDPIRNYVSQKDIMGHRPTSDFCFIHKEVIKYLFEIILQNDSNQMDVFWSWITGRCLSEVSIN